MDYKITEEQAQGLLNYLADRPFKEVYQLISMIQTLEEIKEDKKDGTNKK